MPPAPETRLSLLQRLREPDDRDAWYEFVEIYRPVIYRLSRRKGLQDADAEDLVQKVLLAVAGAIDRWEPDASRGRFRTWLRRVADNAILNALTRRHPAAATGDSRTIERLQNIPMGGAGDSELLRAEFRRELFRLAAERIRPEFRADTWNAFWQSAVEGVTVESVAESLAKSVGSVYAARSRVMRRLKEAVLEFENPAES